MGINKNLFLILFLIVGLFLISGCEKAVCGNGVVEKGENMFNCCEDTGCLGEQTCQNHTCIEPVCGECQYLQNHICLSYNCCKDEDCGFDEVCRIHDCVKLGCGFCQYIENHQCKNHECCSNEECFQSEHCVNNQCISLKCDECQFIENHQCKDYECCDHSDCGTNEACQDNICKKNLLTEISDNTNADDSIVIFVDSYTYEQLENEIATFKEDLINDLDVAVYIFVKYWSDNKEIRNKLKEKFETRNLLGAFFIGDIPFAYQGTEYQGKTYAPKSSDYYFQRLKDNNWFEETEDTIMQTIEQKNDIARDIWTSRLLPPGENQNEKISLLKEYFDRNHDYRKSRITYDKMLYLESDREEDITEEHNEVVSQIAEYTGLYNNPSKVESAYVFNPKERKNIFLNKLENNFEIIFINIHGTTTSQLVGGNTWIEKEDILDHPPGALFIALESCSNGDITYKDYLAGWFLFAGNSLLVKANSAVTFYVGGGLDHLGNYMVLASGNNYGTVYKNSRKGRQSFLLGDPTLTIREKDFENGPRINTDKRIFNLGDINIDSVNNGDILGSAEIRNNGKSDLKLIVSDRSREWKDDKTHQNAILKIEVEKETISPGESSTITIKMSDKDHAGFGEYYQYVSYYTNDPLNPYFQIDVNADIIN